MAIRMHEKHRCQYQYQRYTLCLLLTCPSMFLNRRTDLSGIHPLPRSPAVALSAAEIVCDLPVRRH